MGTHKYCFAHGYFNNWSENELHQLINGNHFLSKPRPGYTESLGFTVKITQLMDLTGIGKIILRDKLIEIRPGDRLEFK